MIVKLDRAFIAELQACGFDVDYKSLVQIYKRSRQSAVYQLQRRQNEKALSLESYFLSKEVASSPT